MISVTIPSQKCIFARNFRPNWIPVANYGNWYYSFFQRAEGLNKKELRLPSEQLIEGYPYYESKVHNQSCFNVQAFGNLIIDEYYFGKTGQGKVPAVVSNGCVYFAYDACFDIEIECNSTSSFRLVRSDYSIPGFLYYSITYTDKTRTAVKQIGVEFVAMGFNPSTNANYTFPTSVGVVYKSNHPQFDQASTFPGLMPGMDPATVVTLARERAGWYQLDDATFGEWHFTDYKPVTTKADWAVITDQYSYLLSHYERKLQFAIDTIPNDLIQQELERCALAASADYYSTSNMLEFWKDVFKFGAERKLWSDSGRRLAGDIADGKIVSRQSLETHVDAYLGTQYGSRLTAADYDTWGALLRKHFWRNREEFMRAARARSEFDPGPFDASCISARCSINYALHYDPRNGTGDMSVVRTLDNLGLKPDSKRIWELLPFSFVVDWMFNVTDVAHAVEANNRLIQLRVIGETTSYKLEYVVTGPYGPLSFAIYRRICSPRATITSCPDIAFRPEGIRDHSLEGSALTFKQLSKLKRR